MSLGEFALGEAPLGGNEVGVDPADDVWGHVAGVFNPGLRLGSLEIEDTMGRSSSCRFVLTNPASDPVVGQRVNVAWKARTIFFGTIGRVRLATEPNVPAARSFHVQAAGLWQVLDRRRISPSYANQTAGFIIRDVLDTVLAAEGIVAGQIDQGVPIVLAEGTEVTVSEFLREVAAASGGVIYIDPLDQALHFRHLTADTAPVPLDEFTALVGAPAEREESREQYRNTQRVKVTGTGGAEVTVEREDADEIAARQALEGGTGIYEAFDEIEHPTSNDIVELERLGIAFALQQLFAAGRLPQTLRAQIRQPLVKLGQLVTVDLPTYRASGTWQVTRLRTRRLFKNELRFELEATITSTIDLALQAWLGIVGAGRAVVQPESVGLFDTLETFTIDGTFVVPDKHGDGSPVEVELTPFGAGGGGASGFTTISQPSQNIKGGDGGDGGKAVSFRTYTPGTVLTIKVGAGGAGGVSGQNISRPGDDGGPSSVLKGTTLEAEGEGGEGGGPGTADGAPGGGTGDHVFTGAGAFGGVGGTGGQPGNDGQPGDNGKVEIRY